MALVPATPGSARNNWAEASTTLLSRPTQTYVSAFTLAVCASVLGHHEEAIAFCETSIEDHDMLFALFHRWLPDFEPVRNDPRFPDIVSRFNASRRV
jgi:hypothetical protein